MSGEGAITMLYNALDIEMCVVDTILPTKTTYKIDENEKFLEYYFDIYRVKDKINAADGISLDDSTSVNGNQAIVGSTLYQVASDDIMTELYDNLGVMAEIYVKKSDNDDETIMCVVKKSSMSEELVINANDIEDKPNSDMELKYYDNSKTKSVSLPKNITVLKNGEIVKENVAEAFDITARMGYEVMVASMRNINCVEIGIYCIQR